MNTFDINSISPRATVTYTATDVYLRWVTPRTKPTVTVVLPEDEDYADAVLATWSEWTASERRSMYGWWRMRSSDKRELDIVKAAGLLDVEQW